MRNFLKITCSDAVRACALAFVFFPLLCGKTFAATPNWSPIQTALNANGTEMPGNVLRFELVRQDLSVTVGGQPVPSTEVAAITNGFIAFKPAGQQRFFVDGSLPAQETEVAALQTALRQNKQIHITAVAGRVIQESPKLVWVHFEANGNGADLAASLATALATIHSPQVGVTVIPGTNSIINPSSILPPNFLKLFDEGFVEQFTDIFAFYLPRPDEKRIFLGDTRAESGLGVGQSFYIQVSFSGGTNITLNIDFALRANEIQAVEDTLRAGGFTITSQTSNFVNSYPDLYFVHVTGSGDGLTLGDSLFNAVQIIQNDSQSGYNF
jgi:hypothetical protein